MDSLTWPVVGWGALGFISAGGWMLAFRFVQMIYSGKVRTEREMKDKDAQVAYLTAALETRDEQLKLVLQETLPTVGNVLKALRRAAADDPEAP